jgi:cytochrome c biogenesis protein
MKKGPREGKPEPQKRGSVFTDITSFFTSVRTTITLLFLLAAASVVGTVVPQSASPDQIAGISSPLFLKLTVILDLYNVYRSWWFISLLILLSLNLLGCLLRRLPAIPAEWTGRSSKTAFNLTFSDPRAPGEIKDVVASTCQTVMGCSPSLNHERGEFTLSWAKHRVYLLGFPLLHSAIIIILLGGLIGLIYGTRGHVLIREGDSAKEFELSTGVSRTLPFQIAVDKFSLTHYPTGEPKEFRSDVRLIEGGKEVLAGSIRVNHPLTFKGISLYQSDYRVVGLKDVKLEITDSAGKQSRIEIQPKTNKPIPGTDCEIRLVGFDPGTTRRGAGAEVEVIEPGKDNRTLDLYSKDTGPVAVGNVQLRFVDYVPLYATGLQIGYDPGAVLVWLGCVSLVLGFSLVLFTNHRRLTVRIQPEGKGCKIEISGRSKRLRKEFREDIDTKIRAQLQGIMPPNPGEKTTKNSLDN